MCKTGKTRPTFENMSDALTFRVNVCVSGLLIWWRNGIPFIRVGAAPDWRAEMCSVRRASDFAVVCTFLRVCLRYIASGENAEHNTVFCRS